MLEAGVGDAEEKMEYGIKNSAGVVRRKPRARLNADDDQPQDGGDPGLQNMVTVGAQASAAPEVPWFPPFAKYTKSGAPSVFLVSSVLRTPSPSLLDGIVRGLSGDHYVVHVAFAETGAADANEARLLQQLRDRAAAAISHA